MNWVPFDELVTPYSIWLCKSYYKGASEARRALFVDELTDEELEAPLRQYLVLILLHPEEGTWVRSKTKHGDLQDWKEMEAIDNVIFLTETAFKPLDFTSNLGHDDAGRMMFYERRIHPPKQ